MTFKEALDKLDKTVIGDLEWKITLTKALEKQMMKENADGCKGCAFENVNEWELPCAKCKRNSKDYWRAKRGDEDAE